MKLRSSIVNTGSMAGQVHAVLMGRTNHNSGHSQTNFCFVILLFSEANKKINFVEHGVSPYLTLLPLI